MPLVHTETVRWLTPHPTHPLLSMISAALCRSVQIESRMDEEVASWVGGLPSSTVPLVGKIPQQAQEGTERYSRHRDMQADSQNGLAERLGCAPPSSRLRVASFVWSSGCFSRTSTTVPVCWLTGFLHGMGMLSRLAHTVRFSSAASTAACSPCPSPIRHVQCAGAKVIAGSAGWIWMLHKRRKRGLKKPANQ